MMGRQFSQYKMHFYLIINVTKIFQRAKTDSGRHMPISRDFSYEKKANCKLPG